MKPKLPRAALAAPSMVAAVMAVAACQDSVPEGQVVATVRGAEITISELEAEIERRNLPPQLRVSARAEILDEIIDEELLAQEARKRKLDRTPAFVVRENQWERESLADLLIDNLASASGNPSEAEVAKFVQAHPSFFHDRFLFAVDQIQFDNPDNDTVMRGISSAEDLEAIEAILLKSGTLFFRQTVSWDTASLSSELAERLNRVGRRPFVLVQSTPKIAGRIVARIPAPLPEASVRAVALQKMLEAQALYEMDMQRTLLRNTGEVKVQEGFGL